MTMTQLLTLTFILVLPNFGLFSSGKSSTASASIFQPLPPPRHRPIASASPNQFAYNIRSNDDQDNSQFRSNDFDFALLKDDLFTSMTTPTATPSIMTTPTNDITIITKQNSDYPSSDISQTFTTNKVQSSTLPGGESTGFSRGTVKLRGPCNRTEQCSGEFTECRSGMCKCQLGYSPRSDDANLCGESRITTMVQIQGTPQIRESTGLSSTSTSTSTLTPSSETQSRKGGTVTGSSPINVNKEVDVKTSTPMPDEPTHHTMPLPEHLQNRNKSGTVKLRGDCNNTEQCSGVHTECRIGMCKCELGYSPRIDDANMCGEARNQMHPPQADPTMIGVVIGLVLMSFTLCVVMRLFAKARFQENRTIFNTPNPRLMNVSLLKGSKKPRRGSQGSINSEGGDGEGQGHPGGHGQGTTESQRKDRISRPRPHRQSSTDTATTISETGGGGSGPGSRPISSNKQKPRRGSASNSNV